MNQQHATSLQELYGIILKTVWITKALIVLARV